MDIELVKLIDEEATLWGENAHVWMTLTAEARADTDDTYFICASAGLFTGCAYLGTVGTVAESIDHMRGITLESVNARAGGDLETSIDELEEELDNV